MRKFNNGKAAGKDEVTGEMINGGDDMMVWDCIIWPLRVVMCLKTGVLLRFFRCTKVKGRIIEVLV